MKLQILILDDASELSDLIKDEIKKNNLNVNVEWQSEYNDRQENFYDLYIIDKINGIPRATGIINNIKDKHLRANIFVVSKHANYDTLKSLFTLEVEGFIDKNSLDISPLINYIQKQARQVSKMYELSEKVARLSSVCQIKTA